MRAPKCRTPGGGGPLWRPTVGAADNALERQAVVQILLLDPDSLATVQRARELDDPDVYHEIMRNLRVLREFREGGAVRRTQRRRFARPSGTS
jgi:hypothetical protein